MNENHVSSGDRALRSRPVRSRRWLSVILGAVIFVSGLVIGGTGTFIALRQLTIFRLHNPEKRILQDAKVLQRRLGLTDDQTREVLAIFSRHLDEFMQFRNEIRPELDAKLDGLEAEVAAVLNEEQARKWNTWFDDMRKTWIPPIESPEGETTPNPLPGV